MSTFAKHCATCACKLTPLERLCEKEGQDGAAVVLGCSQSQVSRVLSGGFTATRLRLELLALQFVGGDS